MTTYFIQILFGATLLLLVALVVNALLYKASASLRHRVWAFTLLGLLVMPILSPVLPTTYLSTLPKEPQLVSTSVHPEVPLRYTSDSLESVEIAESFEKTQNVEAVSPVAVIPVDAPATAVRYDAILCVIWLFGTSVLLIHLVLSVRSARKMVALYAIVNDSILDKLLQEFGIKRPVRLRTMPPLPLGEGSGEGTLPESATYPSVPFICGIFRPTIVLPPQSEHWTVLEKRAVLTHELAHVVRGDLFWQLLTQIVCAVYWFHPLVWFAAYRIWKERESACDDTVVLRGEKPSIYADLLLELANGLRKQRLLACTVAMTRKNKVSERIVSILNPNLRRLPLGRTGTAVFLCVAVLAIVLTATLSPFAQTQDTKEPGTESAKSPENLASTPASATPSAEERAATLRKEAYERLAESWRQEHAAMYGISVVDADGNARPAVEIEKALHDLPQETPLLDIHGRVFMPDGSPADFRHCGIHFTTVKNNATTKGHGFNTSRSGNELENGTFRLQYATIPGAGVMVMIYPSGGWYQDEPEKINRRFVSKPVMFIASENMEPVNITLEEGVPLRGKVTYKNGMPVAKHQLTLTQRIKRTSILMMPFERPADASPELNARLDEYEQMGAYLFVTRYCYTNDEGEYEIFLLPGEYSVEATLAEQRYDMRNLKQAFTITQTDKDKRHDLTLPTPIFVEVENEDGSQMGRVSYLLIHQGRTHGSGNVFNRQPAGESKGSFVLDPITSESGLLYLFDDIGMPGKDKKYGTIETITPEMAGQTVQFKLKAPASVAVTLVEANGKPLANEKVNMVLQFRSPVYHSTHLRITDSATTDAEGKAVLRVVPGKNIATEIQLPDRYVPTGDTSGHMPVYRPYGIERELNLEPGETIDWGIVKVDVP